MKKILLMVVIILLFVCSYTAVAKGMQIGKIHISSIMQIDEESKKLEQKKEEVDTLIEVEYAKKEEEQDKAFKMMKEARTKYEKETNASTDEEIQNALQIQSYDIERLYVKLGVHAKKEGVKLKFVLSNSTVGTAGTKDLNFTVDGSYVAITNFIYAIEDDEELEFRIYNFKLLPSQNEILQASFTVRDVRITSKSLNAQTPTQVNEEEAKDNKQEQTNKQ